MNRVLLLILSVIIFTTPKIFADNIVAIVEDTSITSSELQYRKRLLSYFNQIKTLSAADDKKYTNMVLQSMIDDQVLTEYAKAIGITAAPKEIDTFIGNIEAGSKMQKGGLVQYIVHTLHVPLEEFRKKIQVEVIRSKVIREVLSRNVNISQQDVESVILATNFRDAQLDLRVVTGKNNTTSTRKFMEKLKPKIKSCNSFNYLQYRHFADLTKLNTKLSDLSPFMQNLVKDLGIGQASNVIEDDELRIVVVCDKSIDKFSEEENNSIANFLGNKKLHIKSQKFFQDLRKKAYVKIMM